MNIHLIIQARMSSIRLPKKVLKVIEDKTVLQHVIDRCAKSKYINKIIVATTANSADNILEDYCIDKNINYFRGDENNVLERYYKTALAYKSDIIIRITSDCPLIDVNIIDNMIEQFIKNNYPFLQPLYTSKSKIQQGSGSGFPDGCNPQIFTYKILEETYNNVTTTFDKEHVCPYMVRNFTSHEYIIPNTEHYINIDFSKLHLSLDTQQDYEFISKIFQLLYTNNSEFTIYDILTIINDKKYI